MKVDYSVLINKIGNFETLYFHQGYRPSEKLSKIERNQLEKIAIYMQRNDIVVNYKGYTFIPKNEIYDGIMQLIGIDIKETHKIVYS